MSSSLSVALLLNNLAITKLQALIKKLLFQFIYFANLLNQFKLDCDLLNGTNRYYCLKFLIIVSLTMP